MITTKKLADITDNVGDQKQASESSPSHVKDDMIPASSFHNMKAH